MSTGTHTTATDPVTDRPVTTTETNATTTEHAGHKQGGIKGIVAGLHGAGEAIRGTFNEHVDKAVGDHTGAARNHEIAARGLSEVKDREFRGQTTNAHPVGQEDQKHWHKLRKGHKDEVEALNNDPVVQQNAAEMRREEQFAEGGPTQEGLRVEPDFVRPGEGREGIGAATREHELAGAGAGAVGGNTAHHVGEPVGQGVAGGNTSHHVGEPVGEDVSGLRPEPHVRYADQEAGFNGHPTNDTTADGSLGAGYAGQKSPNTVPGEPRMRHGMSGGTGVGADTSKPLPTEPAQPSVHFHDGSGAAQGGALSREWQERHPEEARGGQGGLV